MGNIESKKEVKKEMKTQRRKHEVHKQERKERMSGRVKGHMKENKYTVGNKGRENAMKDNWKEGRREEIPKDKLLNYKQHNF